MGYWQCPDDIMCGEQKSSMTSCIGTPHVEQMDAERRKKGSLEEAVRTKRGIIA